MADKTTNPLEAFAAESDRKDTNDCGNGNPRRAKLGFSFCLSRVNFDVSFYLQRSRQDAVEKKQEAS